MTILSGLETVIGVNDIKSQPVYFYVQRKTNFTTWNTPMPFEIEKLNVGGGMNLKTGVFTAPKSGAYFFSFSANSVNGDTHAGLFLNNTVLIGDSYGRTGHATLSMQSILNLKKGDTLAIKISWGYIFDRAESRYGPYTHFTGILLDENLQF